MNIFVLDKDPAKAARALSDGHVPKMVLETAQIVATVMRRYHVETPYRPTHAKHPCTLWAGDALNNWLWLEKYARELCAEYVRRFGKAHASSDLLYEFAGCYGYMMPRGSTPFAQAMPEQYRGPDAVEAYRRYYIAEKVWQKRKDGKRIRLARWERGTPAPEWWVEAQKEAA